MRTTIVQRVPDRTFLYFLTLLSLLLITSTGLYFKQCTESQSTDRKELISSIWSLCVSEDGSGVSQREASLQTELDQERQRYQNLLKEFSRLEQRYDNLKEEVSLTKVSSSPHHSVLT